ncbi:Alpha/Beta hydrolase protein [Vararia minispora EC-137]|uniref:Alpha/Beta hydrolase protein n=1 Tax=Vararia minispora EC-137 TaxID=1314806 RepID=A0ACB8QDW8_9AGAM|nr:Alpha/Beta hydrolase protein [Vararia minispora EC-137]
MAESPFHNIDVLDQQLDELVEKLALTLFPDELDNAGWDYGFPLADIKRLTTRWRDGFDWRRAEASLNAELSMFTRDITADDSSMLNIHCMHKASKSANAILFLSIHGCTLAVPEVFEAHKLIPLLVETFPDYPSIHVVAMSLSGYGFPEAPTKRGFNPRQCASDTNRCRALGYKEYVTQGGDCGVANPKHAKASHTNLPYAAKHPFFSPPSVFLVCLLAPYSKAERDGLATTHRFSTVGNACMQEHSSKHQTLGMSLSDSPVGLLAWIYEKLVEQTDNYPSTDDQGLSSCFFFCVSQVSVNCSISSNVDFHLLILACRDYVPAEDKQAAQKVTAPTGFSRFPKNIHLWPNTSITLLLRWTSTLGKVVSDRRNPDGGHLAAYKRPGLLAGGLRGMSQRGGPACGAVSRNTGYD